VALNGCPSATAGKNNRQKHFVVDCEAVIVGIADSAFLDRGRGTGWAMGATVSVINVIPVALLRDTSLPLSAA
jgi:hypothetical protein